MVGHHRENAVVLVYRGLCEFLMWNVRSGVFPFNSVLFGGCLPIVSPDVSPYQAEVPIMRYRTIIHDKTI